MSNKQLQRKFEELQRQHDKVMEENSKLRSGQPCSSISPLISMEEAGKGSEERGGGSALELYARVDLSKVRPCYWYPGGWGRHGNQCGEVNLLMHEQVR